MRDDFEGYALLAAAGGEPIDTADSWEPCCGGIRADSSPRTGAGSRRSRLEVLGQIQVFSLQSDAEAVKGLLELRVGQTSASERKAVVADDNMTSAAEFDSVRQFRITCQARRFVFADVVGTAIAILVDCDDAGQLAAQRLLMALLPILGDKSPSNSLPLIGLLESRPRQLSVNTGQLGRTYLPEIRPRAVLVTSTGRQHDFGGGLHGRLARGN